MTTAVWVGYDNGDGKRRSLGSTETGARLALPIFEPIINAVWSENIAPKAPLSGPSPEAQAHLIDLPIDFASGQRVTRGGFVEHFRLDADGGIDVSQSESSQPKILSRRSFEVRTARRAPSLYQVYDYWDRAQSYHYSAPTYPGIFGWGWR